MMNRALVISLLAVCARVSAGPLTRDEQFARDVYRELVEIDTVTATGDTARAARAMADRLRAAGFSDTDVRVLSHAPRKGNLIARLRGTGKRRPLLLLAHLDVVPANREDWTTDPFTFVEKDGWFYGRGTTDDKAMAAAFVANLVRYKREGFVPDRDLVVVLETDEEISDDDGVGIRWLLENHRALLDAELALNEGGSIDQRGGKPVSNSLQTSEKVYVSFLLEVKNRGGHSSLPTRDNAIYRLAAALVRLSAHEFPVKLNATTRAWLEHAATREEPEMAKAIRAVLLPTPDPAAIDRVSGHPVYNAQLRSTCVATLVQAGHAENALPQAARATVNCRVLPGESVDEVQQTLVRVIADEQVAVTRLGRPVPSPLSPVEPEIVRAVERAASGIWPGAHVVPKMIAGATDGAFLRNAGIPTYGTGFAVDLDDIRAHGKDERMSVEEFYKGTEYLYRLVKLLSSSQPAR